MENKKEKKYIDFFKKLLKRDLENDIKKQGNPIFIKEDKTK